MICTLPSTEPRMTSMKARTANVKRAQLTLPHMWDMPGRKTGDARAATRSKCKGPINKEKRKSKCKPPTLTNAQRAAWAHAHYIVHHGTNQDAARLMKNQQVVKNIPAAELAIIKRMAASRIPTWEQAAAAVFSSSEESDTTLENSPSPLMHTSITPAAPSSKEDSPPTSPMTSTQDDDNPTMAGRQVPTWEQAAAAVFSSSEESDSSRVDQLRPLMHTSIIPEAPPSDVEPLTVSPAKDMSDVTPTKTAKPTLILKTTGNAESKQRYRTRSRTKESRERTAGAAASKKSESISADALQSKPKRRRKFPRPSKRLKRVRIGPSRIKGAGLGVFLLEDAEANEWIARYSGDPLTSKSERRHSEYRVQVHKNLFLDAVDNKHFEGRFINDARGTKFRTNARFAAGYATNECSETGFIWVRIYATRKNRAGEEIYADYGEDFWRAFQQCGTPNPALDFAHLIIIIHMGCPSTHPRPHPRQSLSR